MAALFCVDRTYTGTSLSCIVASRWLVPFSFEQGRKWQPPITNEQTHPNYIFCNTTPSAFYWLFRPGDWIGFTRLQRQNCLQRVTQTEAASQFLFHLAKLNWIACRLSRLLSHKMSIAPPIYNGHVMTGPPTHVIQYPRPEPIKM